MRVNSLELTRQYENIKKDIDRAIKETIEGGSFILGNKVDELESRIAEYLGLSKENVISCASGSDALLLSLMSMDVGPEHEVITTPFTFFATAGCIARLGAKPVFVDIGDDFNIDKNLVENVINERTKAVISVDIFGSPCDQDAMKSLCSRNSLGYISDSAQSLGATIGGRRVGSFADFTTFSFFPSKNLGCYGDGGLVVAMDADHASKIRRLRVHGSTKKYHHKYVGINSRLDTMQAGILCAKLPYLDSWTERRRSIAKEYRKRLKSRNPQVDEGHAYHQYTILSEERDFLKDWLEEQGISSYVYYPLPLHLQECFKHLGYDEGSLPKAEDYCERVLSLPIHESMTDEEVEYVISKVNSYD